MQLRACLLLLGLTACGTPADDTDGDGPDYDLLFPSDRIVDVDLAISDADWALLLEDPLADVEVPADLTYDGEVLASIAIRFKGNSSRNSVAMMGSTRFSFKLDLDELVDGQDLHGVDKLNLNNGFKDPSYLRETLGYDLYRAAGVPAPRTAFARVTLNGEPHGLYTVVEQIDKDFLRAHFEDDTGDLLKPENPAGTLQWRGDSFADYPGIEVKTNEEDPEHASFIAFVDAVNQGSAADLDAIFDVDLFLRWLATNTALVNLDSYAGTAHNYYLYEDRSTGKWVYLPWDVNETYGNFTCNLTADQLIGLAWDAPYCQPASTRVLITRVLDEPDWKARYRTYLDEILATSWGDVDVRAALIRDDVAADPTKFFTTDDFETGLHEDVVRGQQRIFGLTSFHDRRVAALAAQMP